MRILIAPSGYKECLDAVDVAHAIAQGIRRAAPYIEVAELPLVDGGEGTAATLARVTGGDVVPVTVTGPVGQSVDSHFALLGGTSLGVAVVELAAAAGLTLVPRDCRDPRITTSRGVGELIKAALDTGARHILIGCGDSGVNDGGAGLVQALGARLLDAEGNDVAGCGEGLEHLDRIDLSGLDPRIAETRIEVACNIKNVLTGPEGVARVYGPQKGASPEEVERLAAALDRYADIIERDVGCDVRLIPGGGASGGVGAGLHALLGAELRSRFDVLLPHFDLDNQIAEADLVISAEGGLDSKTVRGKIPAEVGDRARALGVPTIVLAGSIGDDADVVRLHGVASFFSSMTAPSSLEDAISHARHDIAQVAENVMRTFMVGMSLANQVASNQRRAVAHA
jgi:glycerate 2-kinase